MRSSGGLGAGRTKTSLIFIGGRLPRMDGDLSLFTLLQKLHTTWLRIDETVHMLNAIFPVHQY